MAIPHAKSTEVIDISPLGSSLEDAKTTTLAKTDALEIIRLVLPANKELKPHKVPGEITVQCIEGQVVFSAEGLERHLTAGKLIYLSGGELHSLRAIEDATVLVTILL